MLALLQAWEHFLYRVWATGLRFYIDLIIYLKHDFSNIGLQVKIDVKLFITFKGILFSKGCYCVFGHAVIRILFTRKAYDTVIFAGYTSNYSYNLCYYGLFTCFFLHIAVRLKLKQQLPRM